MEEKRNSHLLWKNAGHNVQTISHWKNSESTTRAFTAKASFRILSEDGLYARGECINIDQNETLAEMCCGKTCSRMLIYITHNNCLKYVNVFINGFFCIFGLSILYGKVSHEFSPYIGLFWIVLPLQIFFTANRTILRRVWRKSMMPYIQLYVSVIETLAFCDLCGWDKRICVVAPPMLLNQLMIINSDAVYFKKKNKKLILFKVVIAITWKIFMLASLRFGLFPDMYPRKMFTLMVAPHEFFLNNISVFAGKTTSMIVLLTGQIIFRFRHPEQAYALRTNYTIKSNREWNELNRVNRIKKNLLLKNNVKKTREILHEAVIEVIV